MTSQMFGKLRTCVAVGNTAYFLWYSREMYRGWVNPRYEHPMDRIRKFKKDRVGHHGELAIEAGIHTWCIGSSTSLFLMDMAKSQKPTVSPYRMLARGIGKGLLLSCIFIVCSITAEAGLSHYELYKAEREEAREFARSFPPRE